MKNNFKSIRALRAGLGSLAVLAAALGLNATAQPFASPVGDWDVVETGARDGVAQLTFDAEGTITISEILIPKKIVTVSHTITDSRGTGGDDGRGPGSLTNTIPLPAHTNIYGVVGMPSQAEVNFTNADGSAIWVHDGRPAGRWNYDVSGRLIGFFSELSAPSSFLTNLVGIGTIPGTTNISYLTNVEVVRLTNAVSFTGKVSLNMSDLLKSRLTLLASTPAGKVTFQGLKPMVLPDLSGSWYATKTQSGLPYNEFFDTTTFNSDNTVYSVDNGEGPGYIFNGVSIVVRQKKAGFGYDIIQPHQPPIPPEQDILVVRSVLGSINMTKGTFTGRGIEGHTLDTADSLTYKASKLPPAAP